LVFLTVITEPSAVVRYPIELIAAGFAAIGLTLKLGVDLVKKLVQSTFIGTHRFKILMATVAEPLLNVRSPYQRSSAS
jgi:hypothetical protein